MSISGVKYRLTTVDPSVEHVDGIAWVPRQYIDLTGYATGSVGFSYTFETYAGASGWSNGADSVATVGKTLPRWRVRNAMRRAKDGFLALKAAIEAEVAADLGDGATVVVDPVPPWIDEPEEGPPAVDPEEGV